MVFYLSAFILGIFLASFLKISSTISFLALVFFLFLYFNSSKRYRLVILSLFFLCLSFLSTNFRNRNIVNTDQISIRAQVIEKSLNKNKYIIRDKKFNNYILYSDEDLSIGDKVSLKANLKRPDPKFNDFDFDYKAYLKSNGIDYILYEESLSKLSRSKIGSLKSDFRDKVLDRLGYLSENNKRIMASIMLASTDYMDQATKEDYRISGLSHILAMSGLHISILLFMVDFILKIFSIAKVKRFIISFLLIFIYIYLCSLPFGAVRSFIMNLIVFYSFISRKKYKNLDSLFLSAILILIFNPYAILSVSFLLSFFSMAGIIIFYRKIYSRLSSLIFSKILSLSLAVAIMIGPLSLYFFSQYSLLNIISNIFIVPLISAGIFLSFIMVIFSPLAFIIAASVNLLLDISNFLIAIINKLEFLNLELCINNLALLIIYYIFLYFVYKRDRFIKYIEFNRTLFLAMGLVLIFNLGLSLINSKDYYKMDFIYVDQAETSIIRSGGKTIMVDTAGHFNKDYRVGKIYTLKYLKSRAIKKIDYLFISHYDEDHIEGLFDIIDHVNIDKAFVSYLEDNEYIRLLKDHKVDIYLVGKGDRIDIDKDTKIDILSNSKEYRDPNDKSMVFLIDHKNFKALFTGDITEEVEKDIGARADLLKLAHHGSKTSTSQEFLDKVKPKLAVISAGFENSYGHPHEEVLNRLESNNIFYKSTNKNGMISLNMKNGKIDFTSYDQKDYAFIYYLIIYIILILIFLLKFGDYFELQTSLQTRLKGRLPTLWV